LDYLGPQARNIKAKKKGVDIRTSMVVDYMR
jgi:hypothetical protein